MAWLSRRQFLRWCSYLAASGLSALLPAALSPLLGGCRRQAQTAPSPDPPRSARREPYAPVSAAGPDGEPAYLELHRTGELKRRAEMLWDIMDRCGLCPRQCGANRHEAEGFCQATSQLEIAVHHPHFGEERPLVGSGGSGAIFFTNCSLRCVFCINWEISQEGRGDPRTTDDLAEMMLDLQRRGCHNINLVTPTHYSPHILRAVDTAAGRGLRLPLVYNTCGWERLEILEQLDGVVDIYLPDFKYADAAMAAKYSSEAASYPEVTKKALLEMQRQVGVARPAPTGLMHRGLMIRHLVMPNDVGGTKQVIEWIAANLPSDTYLNLMSQYTPAYQARRYPNIARRITGQEYRQALQWAEEAGLTAVVAQG
jgi:putative pyruvate formate lyase activating enzyme